MRVLQVIDSLGLGGAEVLLRNMATRFQTRGVECDVVALIQSSSYLEQSLHADGIPLRSTGVTKLYSPRQIFPLTQMMRKYDIVHVHLFPAQLWAVLAAARLNPRVPLVTTEHNTWNARRRWWLQPFDAWMYPHFEHIACNSDATAEELAQWCPRIAQKIGVIPNGIPLKAFEMAEAVVLPLVPSHVPRLVFIGRFDPQKDHETILRALAMVPQAHLLFVGDGPLRAHLENMTRSLGIAQRVTFLGHRNDIPAILKASDIYIHSTTSDGFGIAACEAMAAGLPVIASDVPGLAQVVEGAGVLFPVGDDGALAREITSLISSEERRHQMSQKSRQRAQQFNIERTVDGCVEMYKSVLRLQETIDTDLERK